MSNNLQQQGGRNVYVPHPQRRNQHLTGLPIPTQPPPNFYPNNVDNSGMQRQSFAGAHHQPQNFPGDLNNPLPMGPPHFVPQGYNGGGLGMNLQQYGQQHAPLQMYHNAGSMGEQPLHQQDRFLAMPQLIPEPIVQQMPTPLFPIQPSPFVPSNQQQNAAFHAHPISIPPTLHSLNTQLRPPIQQNHQNPSVRLGQKQRNQRKQNQQAGTSAMGANNSDNDSGLDSNSPPTQIIYNVEILKTKAAEYLKESDTAQASEKIFQAVRMALAEYVQRLESKTRVTIVPERKNWVYSLYEDLIEEIKKKHPNYRMEIALGWAEAIVLHKIGWCQNNLSIIAAKRKMPDVLRFLEIVEGLDDDDKFLAFRIKSFFTDQHWKQKMLKKMNQELNIRVPSFSGYGDGDQSFSGYGDGDQSFSGYGDGDQSVRQYL